MVLDFLKTGIQMKKFEKTISVEVFSYEESQTTERELIWRAVAVRRNAQAPYSNYWVGCSLITTTGQFFDGCNVENVNWSETGHAEEVAIYSAVAKLGLPRIKMMAVVGAPAEQKIIWPPAMPDNCPNNLIYSCSNRIKRVEEVCPSCGHCLQIIAENCFDENGNFDPTVQIINYRARTGEIYRTTIGDAYPMPFLPQHLGVNLTKDPRFKK